MIICLTETKWKTCVKTDCDKSKTKTEFELDLDWDCSGKLTTVTTVTDKYGNQNQIKDSSNCYGSQCQMPKCPEREICECQGGKKSCSRLLIYYLYIKSCCKFLFWKIKVRLCSYWCYSLRRP